MSTPKCGSCKSSINYIELLNKIVRAVFFLRVLWSKRGVKNNPSSVWNVRKINTKRKLPTTFTSLARGKDWAAEISAFRDEKTVAIHFRKFAKFYLLWLFVLFFNNVEPLGRSKINYTFLLKLKFGPNHTTFLRTLKVCNQSRYLRDT